MSEFVLSKLEIEETAATIAAERQYLAAAVGAIKATRLQIERQIRRDRFFLTTVEPYEPDDACPPAIRRMCEASAKAGVGPMSTVAGLIAQEAMEAMVSKGCTHGWVDNGGDISMMLAEPATLEVFGSPGSATAYALRLEPAPEIVGVCSSSGSLGHSLSFGNADVALVLADDAVLADALATALGNEVTKPSSLGSCFERIRGAKGFRAGLVMIDGKSAVCGRLPKVVEVEHSPERMTTHSAMSSARYTGAAGPGTEART
jgi:ApbE superfamily uncharacterized protein (UPF0280 family)